MNVSEQSDGDIHGSFLRFFGKKFQNLPDSGFIIFWKVLSDRQGPTACPHGKAV